mmetsp:Transcript_108025/g.168922  ORF Transcript_108025/g.168922 Transcript_108025/m.168922 type:complete len:623 (-) Transcript_108025:51-1919(-)
MVLLYDNSSRWRVILQIQGSVYNRVFVPLVLSSIYCVGLFFLFREYPEHVPVVDHPFASQSFGTLIAFAVCFRVNIAWNRFWEACREVTQMFSKWSDAYSQIQGFINSTIKTKMRNETENREVIDRLSHARCEVTHMFSVLSAVAVERLMRGDITRMERRMKNGAPWSELVVLRETLREKDLTGSKKLIPFKVVKMQHQNRLASGGIAADGEETEGEESDGADSAGLPGLYYTSKSAVLTQKGHTRMSGTLRRILLPVETTSSEPLQDSWEIPVSVVGKPSKGELEQLRLSKDRTGLVLLWLGELVTDMQPYLLVPPPILSRVYQELSNGALGFSQALKLADLPFPFIFAQTLYLACMALSIISPISMIVITGNSWITPVLSIGVVVSFWCLNEIAKELENPFGEDANDYPLFDAHERFAEHVAELHGAFVPLDRSFHSKNKERFSIFSTNASGHGSFSGNGNGSPKDTMKRRQSVADARQSIANLRGNMFQGIVSSEQLKQDATSFLDFQMARPGSAGASPSQRKRTTTISEEEQSPEDGTDEESEEEEEENDKKEESPANLLHTPDEEELIKCSSFDPLAAAAESSKVEQPSQTIDSVGSEPNLLEGDLFRKEGVPALVT